MLDVEKLARRKFDCMPTAASVQPGRVTLSVDDLADFARVVMRACARVAALPARPMTHPKQAKVEKKYERVRWYEMGRADAAAAIRHAARKGRGTRGK